MCKLWTLAFTSQSETPVINVNFMPLNHVGGRVALGSSFVAGGTSYFVAEPDLSTLFEDWALVRPTEMALVPRVVDMLFARYRAAVDRRVDAGFDGADAEAEAAAELREQVLGGRVLGGFVATAPLAREMQDFMESSLDVHLVDGYGMTEVGGRVQRRRHHAAAGDRLQTRRRSRTGLLPHRQALSPWGTADQDGDLVAGLLQAAGGDGGGVRRRRLLPHR